MAISNAYSAKVLNLRAIMFRVMKGAAVVGCALAAATAAIAAGNGGLHPMRANAQSLTARNTVDDSDLSGSWEPWYGETSAAVVARYWQWELSIPLGVSPLNDTTGANCGINQKGPVWFLAAPGGGTLSTECTLPAGKALLSGLYDLYDDYPCPDPTFAPKPPQSLDAFLQNDAVQYIAPFVSGSASLDGKPVTVRRVKSPLFEFTGAISLAAGDPCITGSPQLAVADGYYVFVDPLSPGRHVLRLQAVDTANNVTDVTVTLVAK
jgi:hypothetical protein